MADGSVINVMAGDPEPLTCTGLVAILDREDDILITDVVTSTEETIAAAQQRKPAVAIIGHDPPRLDGIELSKQLAAIQINSILLLECPATDGTVVQAFHAGARAVLCKHQALETLVPAIRCVAFGALVMAPSASTRLLEELTSLDHAGSGTEDLDAEGLLSNRELEVFRCVAQGLSNREISDALSVSVATVKSHIHSLCRKLDLRNRMQVIIMAYETGLVRPGNNIH